MHVLILIFVCVGNTLIIARGFNLNFIKFNFNICISCLCPSHAVMTTKKFSTAVAYDTTN